MKRFVTEPNVLALARNSSLKFGARKSCETVARRRIQSAGSQTRPAFHVVESKELDASLLLLPTVGFLAPDDPRITGTIAAIERDLLVDGFVLRYQTGRADDGLPPGEGAFLACSFWLADAYCLTGRMDDARALFDRLLGLRTDLGLLAEEYDTAARRLVGNFPQAFSHVALVNTAHNLMHARKPAQQRSAS